MFQRNLFEAALKTRSKTLSDIAEHLEINRGTLYKKVSQITDFTRAEVQEIKEFLNLSTQETMSIFYG